MMEQSICHILVAEDSSALRLVLQRTLRTAGFSVTTAVDGADAWQLCMQHDFDLIVTDEEMPGLTGSELCQRLRKTVRFAKTPILMVTGKAYELDQALLRTALGISAVFVKPFSPKNVLRTAQQELAASSASATSPK
ncbi:MAG: response regulator [Rubripirellula sp.]|nr:response regulator [Rubripirellula sp.]